ncbi:MAG: Hsp20/alpha crystallin family protein [Acidimicrobiia bacterium]|nr:Hsp20/alpha crystallin family protein [Acidimicrobiia bacterium]
MFRTDPFADFDRFLRPVGRPSLPLDAVRHDGEVIVTIDLPGVARDDIEVHVDERQLTVQAERTRETDDEATVLIGERRYGRFHRQLRLADELDAEGLTADYVDGVLTLSIPVRASASPRKVEIGAGAPALEGAGAA